MIRQNLTLVEAIKTVKDHRGVIPNRGFLRQLNGLDGILRESRKMSQQSWELPPSAPHPDEVASVLVTLEVQKQDRTKQTEVADFISRICSCVFAVIFSSI